MTACRRNGKDLRLANKSLPPPPAPLQLVLLSAPFSFLPSALQRTQTQPRKFASASRVPRALPPAPPAGVAAGRSLPLSLARLSAQGSLRSASACEQDPVSETSSRTAAATQVALGDLSPSYTPPHVIRSPLETPPPSASPSSPGLSMRSPAAPWLRPSTSPGCCGPWLRLPCRESAPRVHFIPLLIPNILSIARAAQAHSKAQPALPPPVWGQ